MRKTAAITSLALAAVLPFGAGAQTLLAQGVLQDDAAEVTATPRYDTVPDVPGAGASAVVQPDPFRVEVAQWSQTQANALLMAITDVAEEGLNPADYRPADLRLAIGRGEGAELNALATELFVWLVEDLRDGRTPMTARRQWFVVDPDAERTPSAAVLATALESGDIAGTLAALNPTHPDYAAMRDALASSTNATEQRLIRANMDRWRWLARDLGGQYLITNVPEYQLRLTVNNRIIRTYKTIVGAPGRTATPQLAETVEGVIFNPTWTVPQSIVVGEGLGNRVMGNPAWARANGYRGTRGANGFISVVQQPGPGNSLGQMKLDMPNPHAIFLHDTPNRAAFGREMRALSHGCVRTERALELAMTIAILGQGATRDEVIAISSSREYTRVPVQRSMPVYITYFTYGRDIEGSLHSFSDIYSRDAPVFAALEGARVNNRARYSTEEVIEVTDDLRPIT